MANRTKFAGMYRALDYFYGGPNANNSPASLKILTAPTATGAGSVTLKSGQITLTDGTVAYPLATNAPVLVGSGSNQETVTPSAVSSPTSTIPGVAGFTATFSNLHGVDDPVASATCGLQEAINDCAANGGGVVIVDAAWGLAGGTTTILRAATNVAKVDIQDLRAGNRQVLELLAADGAINPRVQATYVVTKAGVAALTLAAPTATTDDGLLITVTSATANAHVITATNLLNTGAAANDTATFEAAAGASLTLMAYQAAWYVISSNQITFG